MKLTEIANRLRDVAASIESAAMKGDDFEFPKRHGHSVHHECFR
jgi:hypothetical protein